MKTTKSPWISKKDSANSIEVMGPNGNQICQLISEDDDFINEECHANARLIAAAPELFETLQNIIERCNDSKEPDADVIIEDVLFIAKEAIAKAKPNSNQN